MGIIKVVDGGQATQEEIDLMMKQQGAQPPVAKKATDIQPKKVNNPTLRDILPKEATEGEVASPKQVVDAAMAKDGTYYDLIAECVATLRSYGAHQAQIDAMLNSPLVSQAKGRTTYAQRTALNSFWTAAIGRMGAAGFRYRQDLINIGTATDWVRHFQNGPAQFIVQFALPVGCGAPVDKKFASN